jgi:hypothetical protein
MVYGHLDSVGIVTMLDFISKTLKIEIGLYYDGVCKSKSAARNWMDTVQQI